MKYLALAFAVVLVLAPPGQSSWGAGCGPVGSSAFAPMMMPLLQVQAPAPIYWSQQQGGWWHLYQGSQVQGTYHPEEGYRPWLGYGQWGPAAAAPTAPPVALIGKTKVQHKEPDPPTWQTAGVEWDKLDGGAKASHTGKPITLAQAADVIEQKNIEDDSLKPHVVVKGAKADRQKVLDAVAASPTLKAAMDKFTPHYYDESAWQAKKYKSGTPYVCFLLPHKDNPKKAAVLAELTGVGDPQMLLAVATDAANKADPNYKPPAPPVVPPKTPDQPGPNVTPNTPAPGVPGATLLIPLALLAAGGAVYLLGKRGAT